MDPKDVLRVFLFSVIMYGLGQSLKLKSNVVNQSLIQKLSKLSNQKSWHPVKIQQP